MQLKIEKGIPIPDRYYKRDSATKILREMEVGDSVFISDSAYPSSGIAGISTRYRQAAWRLKMKIAARAQETGCRIWRTE